MNSSEVNPVFIDADEVFCWLRPIEFPLSVRTSPEPPPLLKEPRSRAAPVGRENV